MQLLPGIIALLVGAAGWFYLFYSRAAQQLGDVESARINLLRVRLRRLNGVLMLLLGGSLYAAVYAVREPKAMLSIFLGIFVLLLVVVALALADLRLTGKLRRRQNDDRIKP